MKRLPLLGPACALAVLFTGCGPMTAPLPVRLSDDGQKQIDESWARAFTPPDRHSRQALLDILVVAQPYQVGIDQLSLRSVKRFAGGTAVMEVHFDRAAPADDRFTLTVTDPGGKVIRSERFTRAEVEGTVKELNERLPEPDPNAPDPPAVAAQRAALDARLKRIKDVFPPVEKKD